MSVLPTILDSSKAESIEKWTKKTLEHYGGVDLLVVNAGGPPPGKFEIFTKNAGKRFFFQMGKDQ